MTDEAQEAAMNDSNLKGALCYFPFIGWIISLFFILTERNDRNVRFNALQGLLLLMVFGAVYVLLWVLSGFLAKTLYLGFFIGIANRLLLLLYSAASIALIYKSLLGERFLLPKIGKTAERQV